MADDPLTELDLDVVTITRDSDGTVIVDGGVLSDAEIVYLLRIAETALIMGSDPDDDEDDE
jgi:hypothetical protein